MLRASVRSPWVNWKLRLRSSACPFQLLIIPWVKLLTRKETPPRMLRWNWPILILLLIDPWDSVNFAKDLRSWFIQKYISSIIWYLFLVYRSIPINSRYTECISKTECALSNNRRQPNRRTIKKPSDRTRRSNESSLHCSYNSLIAVTNEIF